jgi:arylsulfatase A-like enzyme
MYLAYHVPHAPYISTPNWMDKNKHVADKDKRVLAGMISELDDSVGRILAKLRELDLEEDTLIFYISDNGAQLAAKYPATVGSNDPLKGKKGQTYEGGVRVPWLVQWKGTIPAGQVRDDPVISLDVLPTALAAAGREDLITETLDGVNLLPFFKKQSALPKRKLFFRWRGWFAVREGKWNAVYPAPLFQTPPEKIVPLSEAKLELYDMSLDKEQRNNIAAEHTERAEQFKQSLIAWNGELTAPGWIAPRDVAVLNRIYGEEGMSRYPGLSYTTVAQKRPPRTADGGRSRERLMQLRDRDQDGALTLKEYIGDPKNRNVPALTRQFNKRDTNQDGKLSLEELKK